MKKNYKISRSHVCSFCGIAIEQSGQRVRYLHGKPLCEDCYIELKAEDERLVKRTERDVIKKRRKNG